MEGGAPSPKPRRAPTSGRVIPHHLSGFRRVGAFLTYCFIRLLAASIRFRWHFHPSLMNQQTPRILCTWHNRLALALMLYPEYARQAGRKERMAAIVSASKDGAFMAKILEHFGVQPVRGSSSRRGPQALLELTSWAQESYDLSITPDGPRGPRYVVQPGVIALAQLTGFEIVPVSYHLTKKITLKSWDRFQVPLPFGTVEVEFGEPLAVPSDLDDAGREQYRRELERRLQAMTVD